MIAKRNKNRACYWQALFSLIWKQTSFETMQNIWKLNNIGKNIIIIKSQWRKEMELPDASQKEHLCPYIWKIQSQSSLNTTRRWRCWGLHSKSQHSAGSLDGLWTTGRNTAPSPCNPSTQFRTSWRIFLPPTAPFLTQQVKFGISCSPLEYNSYSSCKLYTRYTI